MIKIDLIEEDLWDHYSGLPNPMWYQQITELEDEEEVADINIDNELTTR